MPGGKDKSYLAGDERDFIGWLKTLLGDKTPDVTATDMGFMGRLYEGVTGNPIMGYMNPITADITLQKNRWTGSLALDSSRVLRHEVGHWLDLQDRGRGAVVMDKGRELFSLDPIPPTERTAIDYGWSLYNMWRGDSTTRGYGAESNAAVNRILKKLTQTKE